MKTTIEIPDPLFRLAKARAAERGQTLRQLFTEALQEKLANRSRPAEPIWLEGFGKLAGLHEETERVQARIEEAFEVLEPEDQS